MRLDSDSKLQCSCMFHKQSIDILLTVSLTYACNYTVLLAARSTRMDNIIYVCICTMYNVHMHGYVQYCEE